MHKFFAIVGMSLIGSTVGCGGIESDLASAISEHEDTALCRLGGLRGVDVSKDGDQFYLEPNRAPVEALELLREQGLLHVRAHRSHREQQRAEQRESGRRDAAPKQVDGETEPDREAGVEDAGEHDAGGSIHRASHAERRWPGGKTKKTSS